MNYFFISLHPNVANFRPITTLQLYKSHCAIKFHIHFSININKIPHTKSSYPF